MHRRTFCKAAVAAGVSAAFPACSRVPHGQGVAAGVAAVSGDGAEITLEKAALGELADSLDGSLILGSDDGYDAARRVWNGMVDKRPALIVQCRSIGDVVNAVTFASERGLLTAVKGGGHSYPGKSSCDGGLMIDLSPMHAVDVDAATATARVEGGALLGHLDGAALDHGLLTTTGIVSHTGVGGFALGGGMGRTDRLHGLAVDNVLGAIVVTADGSVVRASADENPDLFWAIRGGGGNFGVVTEFRFGLHPFDETVYAGGLEFTFDRAHDLLSVYAEYIDRLPDEANVEPGFYHEIGERIAYVSFCFAGDPDTAEKAIAPFRAVGKPIGGEIRPTSYRELQTSADAYYAHGLLNYLKSGLMLELSPAAIDAMVENYDGDGLPDVWFQHLGGAGARVPPDATAYPHRDAVANLGISRVWDDASQSDHHVAQIRRYYTALEPYTKGFYTNLNDDTEQKTRGNYGGNYARLAAIKRRYDPANFFRLNANIIPAP